MAGTSQAFAEGAQGRRHALRAFGSPGFRLLWPANALSYTCRWMQVALLGWLVLEQTNSAWRVSLVTFFALTPMFLLGLVGGFLADRVSRKRLTVATHVVNLLAALTMTLVLSTGVTRPWHSYFAYMAIGVIGTCIALDLPARRSLVYDFLGVSGITNGLALDSVAATASKMVGPALAGALITVAGVRGGYAVVTVLYLVAVILLWSLKVPRSRPAFSGEPLTVRGLLAGLRYVRGHRTMLAAISITVLMNLLLFPYQAMLPVIARNVLHVGPGLMGLLMAAEGMGSLAGAVLVASVPAIRYHGRIFLGGSLLATFALLLFSISRLYGVSFPILVLLGIGTGGFSAMQATLILLLARKEMQGQALGVMSLAIGAGPFGTLLVGGVASAVSPTFAVGLNACLGLVSLALVGLLMPSIRQQIVPEGQR